jgi:hypothetical protein
MTFDSLINIEMPEIEIYNRVAQILQRNFSAYKDVNVCLMLGPANGDICSVKEVKYYNLESEQEIQAKRKLLFGGEFEKAYVITQFINGAYRMTLAGHYTFKTGDVHVNKIIDEFGGRFQADRITKKALPYELVAGAFREIAEELKKRSG